MKKKKMKESVKGFYDSGDKNVIGLFAGGFPKKLALEWEQDCIDKFNGMRWAKMWSDHLVSRTLQEKTMIIAQPEPKQKQENVENEEIKTIGPHNKEEN